MAVVLPDVLDPARYASTRLPVMEAETLPPVAYTSEAFYAREVERIFMKEWNFIGRADYIPEPGRYFTLELVGVPLIVVRGEDGVIRAFANSCRHRGTRIVAGEGECKAFRCPYHSWVYGLDGALRSAPEMQQTVSFDPAQYGLVPVKLETWGGFLFVNFDPASPALATYLGDLPDKLASYAMDDLVCVRRKPYDLACNWKIFVENAMEELHVATVHRKTIQKYAPTDIYVQEEPHGEYVVGYGKHEGSMALLAGDAGFPRIATLRGRPAEGTYFPMIFPSTMLGCTIDTVWFLELRPQGPNRTTLVHGACFPRTTAARPDFHDVVKNYYKRWEKTTAEDVQASEWQQAGLSSPLSARGRFSYRETLVHVIDNWVLDRVLAPAP
jgi:phenylpropionate dioxygenase-like ring-hydroxylating dioxygenase large terminal subunit